RRLLDADRLAFMIGIGLVMGVVLLRATDDLAVERVLHLALHLDHHRLVTLVGNHRSRQHALGHRSFPSLLRRSGADALALQRLDARDLAAHFAHPARLLELAGRRLETQVECLALQLAQSRAQLIVGLRAQVSDVGHHSPPRCEVSPRRATTLVLIGSFMAAREKASAASGPGTPSSSKRMRPGFTRADQYSTEPLPLP